MPFELHRKSEGPWHFTAEALLFGIHQKEMPSSPESLLVGAVLAETAD